jgi:phosphate:Na+ symporter
VTDLTLRIGLFAAVLLVATSAQAATSAGAGMDWLAINIGLFGGMALFLYGLDKMGTALKVIAGEKMRLVLWRVTRTRLLSLITGAFVTAIVQSSTVTTVLLIGFISARLMSLAQALGAILGAGIGTTITAQLLAFKLDEYALIPVAIGWLMTFLYKDEGKNQFGHALLGIGLIFYGISLMSNSMGPLRDYQPFVDLMSHMSDPLYGILIGTLFTALVHSSAATLAVAIALGSQGLIDLPAGMALMFGANVGTCFTASIAAIGKQREAVRAAVANVAFKVIGVALLLPLMVYFIELVVYISPTAPAGLEGKAADAAVLPRQIANAHTVFNVLLALLFLPFTAQIARLLTLTIPDKPLDDEEMQPKFLDDFLLPTPSLAMNAARSEIRRMGREVCEMMRTIMVAVLEGTPAELKALRGRDEDVDSLYGHIVEYLGKISKTTLSDSQTNEMMGMMEATHHLESIGDLIEVNLVQLGLRRQANNVVVSEKTAQMLTTLHQVVNSAVEDSLLAITDLNKASAMRVINMKGDLKQLANAALKHQTTRLVADEKNRVKTFAVEMDIIDKLQRIYFHSSRVAKSALRIIEMNEARHASPSHHTAEAAAPTPEGR